jgi:hypothetical protein
MVAVGAPVFSCASRTQKAMALPTSTVSPGRTASMIRS